MNERIGVFIDLIHDQEIDYESFDELKRIIDDEFGENISKEDLKDYFAEIHHHEETLNHLKIEYGQLDYRAQEV